MMTAETLKPFIPLPNGATYTKKSRRRIFDVITICSVAILSVVSLTLLALLIWNSLRLTQLETEIDSLKVSLNTLRDRQIFDYGDEMSDFGDSYRNSLDSSDSSDNNLLDLLEDEFDEDDFDPDELGSGDYGDDEDENEEEEEDGFLGYLKEDHNSAQSEEESDNLYEDAGKYWNSRKGRKQRSVAQYHHDIENSMSLSDEKLNNGKDKKSKLKFTKSPEKTYFDQPEYVSNHEQTELPHVLEKKLSKKHNLKKLYAMKKHNKNSDRIKASQYTLNLSTSKNQESKEENNSSIFFGHAQTTRNMDIEKISNNEKGYLRILEAGLYFVYAQINYNNEHYSNGYSIYKNFRPILHCSRGAHSLESLPVENTCYTSGITHLSQGDVIYLKDLYSDRSFKEGDHDSFFGIIRIGGSNK